MGIHIINFEKCKDKDFSYTHFAFSEIRHFDNFEIMGTPTATIFIILTSIWIPTIFQELGLWSKGMDEQIMAYSNNRLLEKPICTSVSSS